MPVRTTPHVSRLCIALTLALSAPVMAQDPPEQATTSGDTVKELDKVTVTGSRLKRTDVEEALPITIVQKAEIDAQGITSAEQLLQQLNIASNGSDDLAANNSIAPGEGRGNTVFPARTSVGKAPMRPWCF